MRTLAVDHCQQVQGGVITSSTFEDFRLNPTAAKFCLAAILASAGVGAINLYLTYSS